MKRVRVKVRWQADADQLAHATIPRQTRTLCGQRPVPERFGWPSKAYCERCTQALDALERVTA